MSVHTRMQTHTHTGYPLPEPGLPCSKDMGSYLGSADRYTHRGF